MSATRSGQSFRRSTSTTEHSTPAVDTPARRADPTTPTLAKRWQYAAPISRWAVIAVAMLLAACGGNAPPAPQREQPRLVVVGDSLAAGRFADSPEETFPHRLATALHAQLELVG